MEQETAITLPELSADTETKATQALLSLNCLTIKQWFTSFEHRLFLMQHARHFPTQPKENAPNKALKLHTG